MVRMPYVAPATTNSTAFALVEPDNTAIKVVVAITMAQSRAARVVRQLQIITGAKRSVIMNGVIKTRVSLVIDDLIGMWTLGSREMSR